MKRHVFIEEPEVTFLFPDEVRRCLSLNSQEESVLKLKSTCHPLWLESWVTRTQGHKQLEYREAEGVEEWIQSNSI